MARRKRVPVNRHEDGSRASIGDFDVDQACNTLNTAAQRECAMYLDEFRAGDILNWFFEEETLRRLRLVKDLVPVTQNLQDYVLLPHARMVIDFKELTVPTILPTAYKPDLTKCQPIIAAAEKALEIQSKYARVKHLLRWFNRNATPGAIRAYWPAVLTLCPDSPSMRALMNAVPTRYDTPRGIGVLLPLIRETASTVAAMELIPADIQKRPRNDVWFSLDGTEREFDGAPYATEHLLINV